MVIAVAKRSSTLMRYGGFVASVGTARVVGVLITSVTFPILVRRLGVQTYGVWSYVIALCAFFELAANPGLTTHMAQVVAAQRLAAAQFLPDFLALRGLSSIVAICALLLCANLEHRPDVHRLLVFYGVAAIAVGLTGSDFFLTSLEFFHARSALTIIQQALYAAGVLVLVRGPKDILWVPASILGSSLIANLAGWVALWRSGFRPSLAIAPRRWRSMLVPSFHYAATTFMGTIYHRTGHLLVSWYLGDFALGLYAAGIRFVDILRNFVSVAIGVLMPRMAAAANSSAGLKRLVNASVSAVCAVGIPLMLGTLATAHLVVPWVLGKNYADAVGPVRLLSGFLLAGPLASLFAGTILYALGRHRAYLAAGSAGALSAIVLSFTLIHFFQLPGICIAFVLAEAAVAGTAYFLIPPDLRELWKNPLIAVSAVSGLLMIASIHAMNSYTARPLAVITTGALVYATALTVLGKKILIQQFGTAQ